MGKPSAELRYAAVTGYQHEQFRLFGIKEKIGYLQVQQFVDALLTEASVIALDLVKQVRVVTCLPSVTPQIVVPGWNGTSKDAPICWLPSTSWARWRK